MKSRDCQLSSSLQETLLLETGNITKWSVQHMLLLWTGFSIDRNFQDVMTSRLKNLDVSVQNVEVMQ